jgi:hypothetical protein
MTCRRYKERPLMPLSVRPGGSWGRPTSPLRVRLGLQSFGSRAHTDRMTGTVAPAMIRQWARQRGLAVGDRGRLAPDVVAAYKAAKNDGSAAVPESSAPSGAILPASYSAALRVRAKPAPGATGTARRVRARVV